MKSLDDLKKSLVGMARGVYIPNLHRLEGKLIRVEADVEKLESMIKITKTLSEQDMIALDEIQALLQLVERLKNFAILRMYESSPICTADDVTETELGRALVWASQEIAEKADNLRRYIEDGDTWVVL